MKDSGKYRITHHLGRRPDSEDAEVIFSYPDEEPARRFYQRHLPPRVRYVLALWRPDGTLIASTIGPQRGSRSSACPTSVQRTALVAASGEPASRNEPTNTARSTVLHIAFL